MNVYIWTSGTLKNAYIGEYKWKPWIYHNTTLWLISLSSDWKNWITIADKNIWASNVWDIGSFFQRGNNYQFPTSWFSVSSSQVNTSSYGPNNYYSSSTFRYGNMDWSSPSNLNLRWDTTNTAIARQWPCASWYHVASATEWNSVLTVLGTWSLASTGQYLYNYLKMPYAWFINNANYAYQFNWQYWFYWSSSSNSNDWTKWLFLQYDASSFCEVPVNWWWKTMWAKIRPFKNEAVVPDSTWTVIYQPN
jgi:hypothetical protein